MELPKINNQFSTLGKDINKNIPHVVVGNKKPNTPQQIKPEDPLIKKLKTWTLIILTILVLGTAVIFILKEIFGRFF